MFAACPQKRWEITTKPATNPMPSWQEKSWQEIKSGQWITPPKGRLLRRTIVLLKSDDDAHGSRRKSWPIITWEIPMPSCRYEANDRMFLAIDCSSPDKMSFSPICRKQRSGRMSNDKNSLDCTNCEIFKSPIWRNGVHFANLHSGHLGISMVDSNTTEYIEKKKLFSNYPATGNSEIFLPHLVLYFTQSRILFTKWREVGSSFFIWKFQAELHNKVMERAFDAFWKLILKYLPFIDQFLPHLLWKFWTRIH